MWLVDEVGTEATVQALRNFLSLTENELEKMGRNGRKLVEEKYSDVRWQRSLWKCINQFYEKGVDGI